MAISADILDRKETHFVLWRPGMIAIRAPELVIGTLKAGYPAELDNRQEFSMTLAAGLPGLWEIPAGECQLANGQVYHYWFKVEDPSANTSPLPLVCCTDPMAFTVDCRLFPPDAPDKRQRSRSNVYFQTANESFRLGFGPSDLELSNNLADDSGGRSQTA